MTNDDILKMFDEAKDKQRQVKILADLNCVKRQEIAKVLADGGRELPKKWRRGHDY